MLGNIQGEVLAIVGLSTYKHFLPVDKDVEYTRPHSVLCRPEEFRIFLFNRMQFYAPQAKYEATWLNDLPRTFSHASRLQPW